MVLHRKHRNSSESTSSITTGTTEDVYDDTNDTMFVSAYDIHELIKKSVILTDFDKICIAHLFWLVFESRIQVNVAKHCILHILRSDINVYDQMTTYLEQCEILNIT